MEDESQQEVRRRWSFGPCLIALYEEQILNAEQLFLLGKITALCHPIKGCWAGNQFFADWWHKTKDHVSGSIHKFVKLGLITIEKNPKTGGRIMRVTFEGDSLLRESPIGKNTVDDGKNTVCHRKKYLPHLSTPVEEQENHGRSPANACVFPDSEMKSSIELFRDRFAEWTIKESLHQGQRGATSNGWDKRTLHRWLRPLEDLLENGVTIKDVDRAFGWYQSHFRDDFVPEAHTLPAFCSKFVKIRSAMDRSSRNGNGNGNGNGNHSKMPTFDRPAEGGLYFEDGEWKSKITVIKNGKRFRVR